MALFTLDTLPLLALSLLVVATGFLIYVQRPRLSRPAVYASLPWLVTGAVLQVLAEPVAYPAGVKRVFAFPFSYVLLGCLCVVAWSMLVQLWTSERARSLVPTYLGVMGLGTFLGPFAVLVLVGGTSLPFEQLLSWLVMPVLALVTTYATLVALGLWLPRTAAFVGIGGGVVFFGVTLNAIVTAFSVSLTGRAPPEFLVDVIAPTAALLGLSRHAAFVWGIVWVHLLVAVFVVWSLAAAGRSRPAVSERGLYVAMVASVLVGANSFVVVLAGGAVP